MAEHEADFRPTALSLKSPPFRSPTPRSVVGALSSNSMLSSPRERDLTGQLMQKDSKMREMSGELEERARLLARTKASIESLQNDLARAHKTEDVLRSSTREQLNAHTNRIAELERQLSMERGDTGAREDEVGLLRRQKAALEEELNEARSTVKRLDSDLEVRVAAVQSLKTKASEGERTIAFQQSALRESEVANKADAARLEVLERERVDQGKVIRELISTAGPYTIPPYFQLKLRYPFCGVTSLKPHPTHCLRCSRSVD